MGERGDGDGGGEVLRVGGDKVDEAADDGLAGDLSGVGPYFPMPEAVKASLSSADSGAELNSVAQAR